MNLYQDKINTVLSYIDFNLGEKHDLGKLAEMAHLSKFHFHRIMSSYLGESLAMYINRIKLEKAAILLKYSNTSIENIAYSIGYETPTSFTKSFKKAYKFSPSEFKKVNIGNFQIQSEHKVISDFKLQTQINYISPFSVLAHQVKGKIGDNKTYEAWAELLSYSYQHNLITDNTKFIAVHWDDPTITEESNLRYDACITLNSKIEVPIPYTLKFYPGGKYLCILYQGHYKYLPLVYNQIFKNYIFEENYSLREEPIFEEFLNSIQDTEEINLLTLIHIPIE